jgi:hypothetical protein
MSESLAKNPLRFTAQGRLSSESDHYLSIEPPLAHHKQENPVRSMKIAALASAIALLSGCASIGNFKGQATNTVVNLNSNNYKVIKTEVTGASSGFFLLGLIPFKSPTYREAKANLYQEIGAPLEGRSVAFANQTEDISSMYFILFSIPKVTVTADLIEFTATNPAK